VIWRVRFRGGVRLECADWGGGGPPVVLLHGLAGYALEWSQTAAWLSRTHRVLAPEQRGHGRSERRPGDVSRAAFVDDAALWIEDIVSAPAVVVGQSLGGHTAFLLAARRPELVRGLVVAEATPEPDPGVRDQVGRWLDAWPVPFADTAAAERHFGGGLRGRAWAQGLERRGDGLGPAFERGVMLAALDELESCGFWDEWAQVRCPVLVVRALSSGAPDISARMLAANPNAKLVEMQDAGHDLHLDQPEQWRSALAGFLREVGG